MGQLFWITDGSRGKYKCRSRLVILTDTDKPSKDPSHIRTHNPPVGMDFIDNNKIKIGQKMTPPVMIGQNTQMKHFRVGHQDIWWVSSQFQTLPGGSIPIVNSRSD